MKVVFAPSSCVPFHARSLEERPLGGTETGVIRLSEAITKLGHDVIVLSRFENPPLSSPLYLPFRAAGDVGEVDALIAVREWMPVFWNINAKQRLFWTGDAFDQPHNVGIGDRRVFQKLDAFLAVSNWQARTIAESSGFPEEKIWVIRNGIDLSLFKGLAEKHRKRLIYTSTPYRGLRLLPGAMRELIKVHPDCELHIFSGYEVYKGPEGYDPRMEADFEALKREFASVPQCTFHGNVIQVQLAKEFESSAILAYPNTFAETSCISAMEAQAAGCVVVTSRLGALPETVGKAGILIDGEPGSPEYMRAFVEALDGLLSDNALFTELSTKAKMQAQNFSWTAVGERLLGYLSAPARSPSPKEFEI